MVRGADGPPLDSGTKNRVIYFLLRYLHGFLQASWRHNSCSNYNNNLLCYFHSRTYAPFGNGHHSCANCQQRNIQHCRHHLHNMGFRAPLNGLRSIETEEKSLEICNDGFWNRTCNRFFCCPGTDVIGYHNHCISHYCQATL